MADLTTSRLARILAGTSGPSLALARPRATSTTSSTVSGSPLTITVRMADSLPSSLAAAYADLGRNWAAARRRPGWRRRSAVGWVPLITGANWRSGDDRLHFGPRVSPA